MHKTSEKWLLNNGFLPDDAQRIQEAIGRAEAGSSGEVAVAIIGESDSYTQYELIVSLTVALIFSCLLLFAYEPVVQMLHWFFWLPAPWLIPFTYIALSTLVLIITFFIGNIPACDRLIIPKKVQKKRVYERAMLYFLEKGVCNTETRSGVLIFISLLEKEVVILTDIELQLKTDSAEWQKICTDLTVGLKEKQMGQALCNAIDVCGNFLHKYFPSTVQKNTLSNEIDML